MIWRRLVIEFSSFVHGSPNCIRKKRKLRSHYFKAFRYLWWLFDLFTNRRRKVLLKCNIIRIFVSPLSYVLNGRIMNSNIGWKSSGKNLILKKNNMLNFKTIEPSTQIALLVNPKKHPNFPKTDLDDAVDNAVSDFWKELEELENRKDNRSLSGPMWLR